MSHLKIHLWLLLALFGLAFAESVDEQAFLTANAQVTHLDPQGFKDKTANSIWFLFFGAVWCPHCKKLTPSWLEFEKLVQKTTEMPNFHVAKVECTKHENFCIDHHVEAYPALKLYVNGQNTTIYADNNSLTPEALMNWSREEYKKHAPKITVAPASMESKWKSEVPELKKMAEKSIQFELFGNTDGKVMELTDQSFTLLTNQSAWFVMFYAPWCGHCHKLLPIWDELAMTVKGKLNIAKVDCTQNGKTCRKFFIQGYPTLKLFLDGVSNDYDGDRQLYPLRDFALSYSTKMPFAVVSASEVSALIKKNEVNYFYLYDGNQPEQKRILSTVLPTFISTRVYVDIYVSPDPENFQILSMTPSSVPILVVVKENGSEKYIYPGLHDASELARYNMREWILTNRFPLISELTTDNANTILGMGRLVVIAMLSPMDSALKSQIEMIKDSARAWRKQSGYADLQEKATFTWLDGVRWFLYIKRVYQISSSDLPIIIIADPEVDEFYTTGADGNAIPFQYEKVIQSLNDAMDGKLKAKYTSGWIISLTKSVLRRLQPLTEWMTEHVVITVGLIVIGLFFIFYYCIIRPMSEEGTTEYSALKMDPKSD